MVEAIAKNSQNIKWEPKVDGQKMGHKYIRRVSLDQFYALVTREEDAFYQMCMVLPEIIDRAVSERDASTIPNDTVFEEVKTIATQQDYDSEELSIAMAFYLLGFASYLGFER